MGIVSFAKDTKGELKHVSWPTRNDVVNSTILVIVLTIVVAVLLLIFDKIFAWGLTSYLGL